MRPEEVAKTLGIGRSKVYELITKGTLPSVEIGRSRRVTRQAVEEFVSRLAADAAAPRT